MPNFTVAGESPITDTGRMPVDLQQLNGVTVGASLPVSVGSPNIGRNSNTEVISVTPLAANGVYTSPTFPGIGSLPTLTVSMGSDVAGSLQLQMLVGAAFYPVGAAVALAAATGVVTQWNLATATSYRLVYTNGATAQTVFEFRYRQGF